MGADVIKVEPAGGDISRHLEPSRNGGNSATFRSLNRGKRGIVVDLSNSKGREVCLKLAATCDVFVHSIRPQAIAKLGLGYDVLNKASPNIVYCNMLGFGRDGRYSGSAAYDDTIQALSGAAWLQPMFETMASFVLVAHLTGAFYDPPITPPVYPRAVSQARRPYATCDGHLAVLVYNDKQWRRFAAIAGREELLQDGRFETVTARSINIEAYYDLIASIIATRSTHEWLASLGEAGIPCARQQHHRFVRGSAPERRGLLHLPRRPA